MRRIFGPKREEVAGGWRILHNEELHKFYASQSKVVSVLNQAPLHEDVLGECRFSSMHY
jgi:hypothetical protein